MEHVLVNCKSHHAPLCLDYFRWLYTAITRTSQTLYVVNQPKIKIGGGPVIIGNGVGEQKPDTVIQPVAIDSEELNRFGIGEGQAVLIGLLGQVKACLEGTQVEIIDIRHYQYQERYFLQLGDSTVEAHFNYNGKNKISSMQLKGQGELQSDLDSRFGKIIGSTVANSSAVATKGDFHFDEDFLSDFYQRVRDVFPHMD